MSWQEDTQSLSLTTPSDPADPQGWSIIIPAWDDSANARNEYHLSVTLVDIRQQRVTSDWISLKRVRPASLQDTQADRFDLMAPLRKGLAGMADSDRRLPAADGTN